MGRELSYCGCCGKRLDGQDVERGGAVRAGGGFLCSDCAPGVEAAAPGKPVGVSRKDTARRPLPAGTRRIPTTRMTHAGPPPKRRAAVVVGLSVAAAAVVGLGIFLFVGGKEEPSLEPMPLPKTGAGTPPAPAPAPPPAPDSPAPTEDAPGREAKDALEELKRRSQEACGREEFGKAVVLWEEARPRFDTDAWKETVEAEVRGVRHQAGAAWKALVESTPAAAREGLRERIKPWNLPEIARELEEMLKPKELSHALKAYREAWGRALVRAAAGEWDAALAELGNPEDAEARAEAEADRAILQKVRALPPAPRVDGGRELALKYAKNPQEFAEVKGVVVRADDQRVELEMGDKKRVILEWDELSAGSRAALLAGGDADAPSLAALCLLEGDLAAAEGLVRRDAVPAKYWARAAGGTLAPPARDRREYEARDLFHAAEFEWRDPEKYGEAIEKYKMILRDYVGTSIAIRNMVLITKRSESGKEYVLLPAQLKANGPFGEVKIDGAIPALTLSSDVSGPEEQNTYVEAGFYALPGAAYRGWAFLGACCAETFAVYYQTTEGKGRDPKTRKEYVLDPGRGVAMPLDHKIKGLKPTHAGHGGEKKPARWEWVALPLPASYAAPGRKVFRFLANQKGFSVAAVLFSSMRDRPPDKDEMVAIFGSELDSPRTSEPGAEGPAAVQRGQPRPEDWLVLGLFPGAGIDDNLPPESGIRMKYDASVRGGPTEWKSVKVVPGEENGSWKAKVDFHKVGIAGKGIAFAMIHVRVPLAMKLKLHYEHDDDMKLYVNGQMVKKEGRWGTGTAVLNVAAGWNCVLFKIWDNGKKGGAFCAGARFTDESDSPVRGLTFDAYGPIRR